MKKARKGLGRGLSALIPEADMDFLTRIALGEDSNVSQIPQESKTRKSKKLVSVPVVDANTSTKPPKNKNAALVPRARPLSAKHGSLSSLAELIPLTQIEPNPYQPRRTFNDEEMQELSASIQQHGVLQPVLLRPILSSSLSDLQSNATIQYQLIAGERRWRASQKAGLNEIPAIIRLVSDQQALELAVIENVQRHDISALDAANAYQRLSQEFALSQEEIAQRVGKSRVSISNTIRLLDLPDEIQKALTEGAVTEGHGRAILLASGEGARRAVFRRLLRDKLSVRATEDLARSIQVDKEDTTPPAEKQEFETDSKSKKDSSPEIRRIEEGLQKYLGTRVRLRPRRRGGQVVIQYFSNEELERILKNIIRS